MALDMNPSSLQDEAVNQATFNKNVQPSVMITVNLHKLSCNNMFAFLDDEHILDTSPTTGTIRPENLLDTRGMNGFPFNFDWTENACDKTIFDLPRKLEHKTCILQFDVSPICII
jgi:hypothetical protein